MTFSRPTNLRRSEFALLIGSIFAAVAVIGVLSISLWQYREEVRARAEQAGSNLSLSLQSQVENHLQVYRSSLNLVIEELTDPALVGSSQRLLANIAKGASYVGSILVLDRDGNIVSDSAPQPRTGNFADRDYFQVQLHDVSGDTYVSEPYRSRLGNGEWSIALSRRLAAPDGTFAGVAVLAVRLNFARAIMDRMLIGPTDALVLVSRAGHVLMRRPDHDGKGDVGLDLSTSANFQRIRSEGSGAFTATASIDGVHRMYHFARVPNSNLIVNVGLATGPIFAAWRERAIIIGSVAGLLSFALIAFALLLRRELHLRASAEVELERLAMTDFLTGLANRRRFDEMLQREWRRAARTASPLSLLVLDADHFKQINDRYGHTVGDHMLRLIGQVLEDSARRPGDTTARIGGEEFAMILPETTAEGAILVAERIRSGLSQASVATRGGSVPAVTISIGVAETLGRSVPSAPALFDLADKAVYVAKQAGRDRVRVQRSP